MDRAPLNTEISEAPRNGAAFWIHASDGPRLRVAFWPSQNPGAGTAFIFPGRTEYIEKYGRTVSDFQDLGLSTLVIDWRGQGLADRATDDPKRGHVGDYAEYQLDVAAMLAAAKDLKCPKPWFLIGHSMGAAIGLRALDEGLPVGACAFTSPMWDINIPPVKRLAARPYAWASKLLGKDMEYAPGSDEFPYVTKTPFETNRLTHDPEMYQYYIRQIEALPDYQLGGLSIGWLRATLKETRRLSRFPSPAIPCICFLAGQDVVIDLSAAERKMSNWDMGEMVRYDRANHDIFSEVVDIRKDVVGQIANLFLKSVL